MLDGRLFIAGQVAGFQHRLLNLQRHLMAVSRRWRLPDLDVMIEQVVRTLNNVKTKKTNDASLSSLFFLGALGVWGGVGCVGWVGVWGVCGGGVCRVGGHVGCVGGVGWGGHAAQATTLPLSPGTVGFTFRNKDDRRMPNTWPHYNLFQGPWQCKPRTLASCPRPHVHRLDGG